MADLLLGRLNTREGTVRLAQRVRTSKKIIVDSRTRTVESQFFKN